MSYNQQWPGHGQVDMTDSMRELAERTPQLPIDKIAKIIVRSIKRLIQFFISKKKRTAPLPQVNHHAPNLVLEQTKR